MQNEESDGKVSEGVEQRREELTFSFVLDDGLAAERCREPFKWCPGHDVLVMGTDVLVREIHAYYDALERESQTDTNVLQSNNPRLFILEFNHALLYSTTTTRHRAEWN
ncbi:unnamed protein product [Gadus morhua 'NCC']